MRYFLFVAYVILLVLAAGCTTQTPRSTTSTITPTATATTIPTANPSGIEVSVHSVVLGWNSTPYGWSEAPPGEQYAIVDLSVKNVGNPSGYKFDMYSVTLRDSTNHLYTPDLVSTKAPGTFLSQTIPLGETQRGSLVFIVPASDKPGMKYWLSVRG